MMMNSTFYGAPETDPTSLDFTMDVFAGDTCASEVEILGVIMSITLAPSNDVQKTYNATFNTAFLKATELISQQYDCSETLVPGQLYDIT